MVVVQITLRELLEASRVVRRRRRRAGIEALRAARVERASRRQIAEERYRAFDGAQALAGMSARD
jgi:hypothetical protein